MRTLFALGAIFVVVGCSKPPAPAPTALPAPIAREIGGQVFIVTRGGSSVKIGEADVQLFRRAEIDQLLRDWQQYLETNSPISAERYGAAGAKLMRSAVPLFGMLQKLKPVDEAKSDGDGNFILRRPPESGSFVVVGMGERQAVGEHGEAYFWIVPEPLEGNRLLLSNSNMSTSSDGGTLAHTSDIDKSDLDTAIREGGIPLPGVTPNHAPTSDAAAPLAPPPSASAASAYKPGITTFTLTAPVRIASDLTLPAGTKAELVQVDGRFVTFKHDGLSYSVPKDKTDLP